MLTCLKLSNGQGGVPELLIPATHSPQFVVCDQYGNTSIIRGGSRQTWNIQIHDIIAALIPPSDNAVIFIRQPHSIIPGQKIEVVLCQGNSDLCASVNFGALNKAFNSKKCGIAIYVNDSFTYLLTCYDDGTIARNTLVDLNRAPRLSSTSHTPN